MKTTVLKNKEQLKGKKQVASWELEDPEFVELSS